MATTKNKEKLLDFFHEFHLLAEKHNLWYVAESGTLLGAIREKKMIEWDDDIDIMISIETYNFLKTNYPNNFLDADDDGYPFTFAKWVPDKEKWKENDIFIDMFVLFPTTFKKIKKFGSLKNRIRFCNQMFHKGSFFKVNDLKGKFLKFILWPTQFFTKKINFLNIREMLLEKENPETNLMMNLPTSNLNKEIRPLIINRVLTKFENFKIYVSKESDLILKRMYGDNYMTPIKSSKHVIHIDTINTIIEK